MRVQSSLEQFQPRAGKPEMYYIWCQTSTSSLNFVTRSSATITTGG